MTHGNAVIDGNGVEFAGDATCLFNSLGNDLTDIT
jgi:hypothetical protein